MECAYCKHRCPADARSCPRCGAPLTTSDAAPAGLLAPRPATVVRTPAPMDGDIDDGRTVARLRLPVPGDTGDPAAPTHVLTRPDPVRTAIADPMPAPIAGRGQRFAGALLDVLLLSAVSLAAQLLTGFMLPRPTTPEELIAHLQALAQVAGFVGLVALAYYTVGNALGRTLGKRLVGTRVVDQRTGERPGWARGFGRALMLYVLALPAGLGFLSVLGANGRGWHDIATRTVVVRDAPSRKR